MTHSISEIQAKLADLGYLSAIAPDGTSNIDGRFGERSLDAYNHYRATLGKGAVVQANPVELQADLWPDEQPPPKPPSISIFDQIGTLLSIINLLKGKTMTSDQLTGVLRALIAALSGYFIAKGWGTADFWTWIGAGVTGVVPIVWTWINNRPKTIVPIAAK